MRVALPMARKESSTKFSLTCFDEALVHLIIDVLAQSFWMQSIKNIGKWTTLLDRYKQTTPL
jgi:hypothetical protein